MNSKFDLWLIAQATRRQGIARDAICARAGHRAWRGRMKNVAKSVGLRLVIGTGQKANAGRAIFYFMPASKAARFA
jgi:hypothetical protein